MGLDLPSPARPIRKLDCYFHVDKVAYWLSRPRDLIASLGEVHLEKNELDTLATEIRRSSRFP